MRWMKHTFMVLMSLLLLLPSLAQATPKGNSVPVNRFIITLALMLFLCLAVPSYATIYFSEDYEVATLGVLKSSKGWEHINGNAQNNEDNGGVCYGNVISGLSSGWCSMDIVSSTSLGASPHGGSKMVRMTYPVGEDPVLQTYHARIGRSLPGATDVWERYWVRFEKIVLSATMVFAGTTNPGTPGPGYISGSKQHYWNPGGAASFFIINEWFNHADVSFDGTTGMSYGEVSNGQNHPCPRGPDDITCYYWANQVSISAAVLPINQWVCIETHKKLNTVGQSDGQLELYQDGVRTVNWTGLQLRLNSDGFNYVENYRQGTENAYRYEDDWVVGTTRIGCGSGGDITPPGVPQNVQVTFLDLMGD